jgi:hypothetical protein
LPSRGEPVRVRDRDERPAAYRGEAGGDITESLAFTIADWTRTLPADMRAETDRILLDAAAAGASLDDLATIAGCAIEQWRQQRPDPDDPDGVFEDRSVRVGTTFGGAGVIRGDLTPECATAVRAVLEALGRAAGGVSVNAVLLDEYVTGAVLDALESPRVQEAVRAGRTPVRRAARSCWRKSARRRTSAPTRGVTGPRMSSTRKTGWTSGSAPTSASPGRARNTTGSAAPPRYWATYRLPTGCVTPGKPGTPTGSGQRSRRS